MGRTMTQYLDNLVAKAETIEIVSGEGDGEGTTEDFEGTKTVRAIRSRLTKERCGGDRWAYASIDGQRCDDI